MMRYVDGNLASSADWTSAELDLHGSSDSTRNTDGTRHWAGERRMLAQYLETCVRMWLAKMFADFHPESKIPPVLRSGAPAFTTTTLETQLGNLKKVLNEDKKPEAVDAQLPDFRAREEERAAREQRALGAPAGARAPKKQKK